MKSHPRIDLATHYFSSKVLRSTQEVRQIAGLNWSYALRTSSYKVQVEVVAFYTVEYISGFFKEIVVSSRECHQNCCPNEKVKE